MVNLSSNLLLKFTNSHVFYWNNLKPLVFILPSYGTWISLGWNHPFNCRDSSPSSRRISENFRFEKKTPVLSFWNNCEFFIFILLQYNSKLPIKYTLTYRGSISWKKKSSTRYSPLWRILGSRPDIYPWHLSPGLSAAVSAAPSALVCRLFPISNVWCSERRQRRNRE